MREPFKFKQFSLTDSRSAMKLSTDAVLLGAFTTLPAPRTILDIGTGSGIVALMLAQRCDATITAIDIDQASVEDARQNFRESPWSDRMHALNQSLQEFADNPAGQFDVIACNPPFFMNSQPSPYPDRNLSKHAVRLSLPVLVPLVRSLLHPTGSCSFIIPAEKDVSFHKTASSCDLYLHRKKWIFPKAVKKANRILLEYRPFECPEPEESRLVIRHADNSFTAEYKQFTRDFYLNF